MINQAACEDIVFPFLKSTVGQLSGSFVTPLSCCRATSIFHNSSQGRAAQNPAEQLCVVVDSNLDLLLICMMPRLGGKAVLKGGQEQNSFRPNNDLLYCLLSEKWNSLEWLNLPHCVPLRKHPDLSSCGFLGFFLVAYVFCCVHKNEFLSFDPGSLTRAVSNAYVEVFVLFYCLHVKLLSLGWLLVYLHASTCLPSSAYHKWYQLKGWGFNPSLNFHLHGSHRQRGDLVYFSLYNWELMMRYSSCSLWNCQGRTAKTNVST